MMPGNWWRASRAGDRCMERSRSRPRMCRWSGRQAISKWQLANSKKPKPKSNQTKIKSKGETHHGDTETRRHGEDRRKSKRQEQKQKQRAFPTEDTERKKAYFYNPGLECAQVLCSDKNLRRARSHPRGVNVNLQPKFLKEKTHE